jgi:hypothetical protein
VIIAALVVFREPGAVGLREGAASGVYSSRFSAFLLKNQMAQDGLNLQ